MNPLERSHSVKEDTSTKMQSPLSACDIFLLKAVDKKEGVCVLDSKVKLLGKPNSKDVRHGRISQANDTYGHHPRWSLSQCEGISCCVA